MAPAGRQRVAGGPVDSGLGFLDSCWLVCEGRRLGPLPYDRSLEELQALHAGGVPLPHLTIVGAPRRAARARWTAHQPASDRAWGDPR